jgi:hypothetical protein
VLGQSLSTVQLAGFVLTIGAIVHGARVGRPRTQAIACVTARSISRRWKVSTTLAPDDCT